MQRLHQYVACALNLAFGLLNVARAPRGKCRIERFSHGKSHGAQGAKPSRRPLVERCVAARERVDRMRYGLREARKARERGEVLPAARLTFKVVLPCLGSYEAVVSYELKAQVIGVVGQQTFPHAREAATCVEKDLAVGCHGK